MEKECKQIICIQNDNGSFSGVQINLFDVVKTSLGVEDGNIKFDFSASVLGHTGGIELSAGKDGLGISAGHDDGKTGNDVGVNINLDLQNGILGAYHKEHKIEQTESGSLIDTVEKGFRTGTGIHGAIIAAVYLAPHVAAAGAVALPLPGN